MTTGDLAERLRAVFIVELEEQTGVMSADLLALERDPSDAERLKSLFRVAHTLKGAARAVGVEPIERLCHGLESMLAPARERRGQLGKDHFSLLFAAHDALSDAVARMRAGDQISPDVFVGLERRLSAIGGIAPGPVNRPPSPEKKPEPAAPAPPSRPMESTAAPVRVAPEKLDQVLAATDDLRMVIGRIDMQAGAIGVLEQDTARFADGWTSLSRRVRGSLESSTDRDSVAALDALDALLRPLVRHAARLATLTAASRYQLKHISAEVSDRARRLRMRPFQEICEALPRVARDVASQRRREVELRIVGGDVEADRAVLDALREPLLHLVRNAVDHGIEEPAARVAAGKPRVGLVTVRAEIRSQRLLVSVTDDGAGVDTEALRAVAGPAASRDDRDIAALVFESGVTTRGEATAISGRGIGLDVVRTAVDRIGGNVTLDWEKGKGTTFVLHCPLTLAAIRAVLVSVGAHTFAVPIANVIRVLRIRRDALQRAEGQAVMSVDGKIVRLIPLASILGPPFVEPALPETIPAILLESVGRRLLVAVDALIDEREITVRAIEHGREAVALLTGATMLPDLGVAPVLNTAAVIARASGVQWRENMSESTRGAAATNSTILVADDSITTRALEQSMLEAAGYDVITAVDGRAAWQALEDHGADLVVSDVEMPGMDGFALCRTIRSSPRFARLPVVLVTALEREEQRAEGLAAGADAYIGKSTFDQRTLLDVVRQFLG